MKTVTICGSMRFKNEMMKTSFMLELDHHFNVLQCVYNTENKSISESEQKILEEAHFKKIEISDAIYVLDINGYIGKQVTKEIEYAESLGKEIIYDSKFIEENKLERQRIEVKFYDSVDESLLRFAVIISKKNGQWVLCKHKDRDTFEVPGGHREEGEEIIDTAKRELYEETGAIKYSIKPICVYSVTASDNFNGVETFGGLYYADIEELELELHSEIEKVFLLNELPDKWTYPLIQPKLLEEANRRGFL